MTNIIIVLSKMIKYSQATAWTRIVIIMLQKKCKRRQWQLCNNYPLATAQTRIAIIMLQNNVKRYDDCDKKQSQATAQTKIKVIQRWNFTPAVALNGRRDQEDQILFRRSNTFQKVKYFSEEYCPFFCFQKWDIVGKTIVNRNSGRCLDIA